MMRAAAIAVLGALLAGPAAAWDPSVERPDEGGLIRELRIGAQVHDVPYMWSGFHREPYSIDLNLEVLFAPVVSFWGGSLHPVVGTTINFEGYTSKAYTSLRWQRDFANSTFLGIGLGVAIHDGETFTTDRDRKQLGRRWLFHDSFEYGYRYDAHNSISIYYEHISNADTAAKNHGLDTLGVRYGYRF
jgi:lipid A 3-O-deacylase